MTTTELRTRAFQLIVAPGVDGKAAGSLYLDDGDSLEQDATAEIEFEYSEGRLSVKGQFMRDAPVDVESVVLLGQACTASASGSEVKKQVVKKGLKLSGPTEVELA